MAPFAENSVVKGKATVEFYSGSSHAERPVALVWQGQRYEVTEVERSWLTPGLRHWLVRTAVGLRFQIAYAEQDDATDIEEVTGRAPSPPAPSPCRERGVK